MLEAKPKPAMRRLITLALVALTCLISATALTGAAMASAPMAPRAIVTQDLAHGLTPADLANSLVGNGVSISNVTYTGTLQAAGLFTGGLQATGIDHGVILGSGDIALVPGPNTVMDATAQNFMPGDAQLSALSGFPTFDADILEFDFVPLSNTVFFQYAFGSEEYNEWVNTQFNDVFAFFINGQNCANVPGTGSPVSINTINNGLNPTFYHDNDLHPVSPYDTQLDGLTVPMLCQRSVVPGQTYHIKLAIADSGDPILDSAVFIQGGSFSSGPTPTPTATFTAGPTRTSTPIGSPTATPTPHCGAQPDYVIDMAYDVIDPGTTLVPGSQCDDCASLIALPFNYAFYGNTYRTVHADSNGNLQFSSDHDINNNACLPYALFSDVIAPYWDDLDMSTTTAPGLGIYTSVSGSAPDRIFNIEWRACLVADQGCGGNVNFEVKLYEGQPMFDIVYGVVPNGGAGATIGVQMDTGSQYTQYACNTTGNLWSGLSLHFAQQPCATPVLVGHVTWQDIPQDDPRNNLPLTLTLKMPGSVEINAPQQTTDASGFFTVPVATLPNGVYSWRIQGPDGVPGGNTTPGFLANCGSVTLAGALQTDMENGMMKGGDANNDNIVSAADFVVLKADFGLTGLLRADFNNDNVASAADFNTLKSNFDTVGCSDALTPGYTSGRPGR